MDRHASLAMTNAVKTNSSLTLSPSKGPGRGAAFEDYGRAARA
jgi:hypothetical protein